MASAALTVSPTLTPISKQDALLAFVRAPSGLRSPHFRSTLSSHNLRGAANHG